MKLMSKQHVKGEAKKGHIEAIRCSIAHWKELIALTPKDWKQPHTNDLICYQHCSLCQRYMIRDSEGNMTSCKGCPLKPRNKKVGCGYKSPWHLASYALEMWYGTPTSRNWEEWLKAGGEMLKKLEEILSTAEKV